MSKVVYVEPLVKPIDRGCLITARTAFLTIWNMECSHCPIWIRNGLLRLDGVWIVDVFHRQAVAAITFDPQKILTDDLIKTIYKTGEDICHFYGAELIGEVSATQALHL